MLVADVAEGGGNAIEERFAADEAVVGKKVSAIGEMLAAAEPDFEMERPLLTEQARGGELALFRHGYLREQRIDQLLLPLAQLMPA
jgi:hypothetical protein